uniref:inorganic diphosphatase n=1 Tax=Corethron hystrix TaxID=216773 RepID=A0A7S1FQX0_9STRA|mmetsp:Transcript_21614/g.49161  ORF Transcript_21614/g.49161 Transcript_21614/m.49161 type:complete len:482 (+) Transcript_21614:97-1542(+)|eukprot:CAMPEP_0113297252 /NCGR_PEP_ID=MMETSP0010_2-20120614/194_1 /TAXON_ID=216773 ORGANISM="Corethron hystrix, Strain 308" /NCGR_SAMPLE_ID=MMETSP0010_2 /ASSEMBLY_ACC=CAM_ASM_000155 /LENGTH=481 /DNA_ID=CAMNT_0000150115 /DNA_START=60 /DNA_END=1505 /DNA_ORIENTATION=- /assembly_acc=CAM_ASM_000155
MAASNDEVECGAKRKRQPSVWCAGAAKALELTAGDHEKKYSGDIIRKRTEVEEQVIAKEADAELIVESLPKDESSVPTIELYLPKSLKDCIFCGHIVTDLDSIAGAIGAASLYGGTAASASAINSETQFALEYWGIAPPPPIEEMLAEDPGGRVCLVDHQQTSQMNPAIRMDNVVGVIDHHALQSKTIVTDKPIYIDIRPWGSMSTIIAHTFLTHRRRPSKAIAGMLLCAILSDTLNLLGPTTTEWDRLMVAVLAEISHVDDIQLLASQQFKAKSKELATMSAVNLVNGDQKTFTFTGGKFEGDIGFAVVETTDDDAILCRVEELLPELVACKKEKGLVCLFLAVVNIVKLHSNLLLCGPTESALASEAFGGSISMGGKLMDLGSRVSRKKDFIPVITMTIKDGWEKPLNLPRGLSTVDISKLGTLEIDPIDPHGNVRRKGSILVKDPINLDDEELKDLVNLDNDEEYFDEKKVDDCCTLH